MGLESVARKRVGGFSLGMGQRLGIAAALLGDPATLILDEPSNGLDPEGIRWIRNLLKQLAAEGRTVFVSSHLMSEIALTAERLVVIGRGRLIADTSVEDFVRSVSGDAAVRVRCADPAGWPSCWRLRAVLAFWFAYIVTRPLGASFADWLAVPHSRGGLGFGYGPVSLVLAVLIVGFVAYLASSRIDVAQVATAGEYALPRIVCSTRSRTRPLWSMNW